LAKDSQVFLQLVRKTKGHAYVFHTGLGNTTHRRLNSKVADYEPQNRHVELIDAAKIGDLSFANAIIVRPVLSLRILFS
jgi:hypothetical protein